MNRPLIIAAALVLSACTDASTARRAVEAVGLTEVRTTGYRFWGCSQDETFRTGFEARNAQGRAVTGVVCSDWFKGATVRFD